MSSECEILTLASLCGFLKENNNYLILTHVAPDGDTLGSAYALKYGLETLNKRAQVVCCDKIPHKYNYFIEDTNVDFSPECVIAVDVADIKLLGDLHSQFEGKIDLCIDHHISNTKYAKRLYLDADASAAAECVFEILDELGATFDRKIANALYTGLSTDTGCFKYASVTEKTHRIAAKLHEIGVDAAEINRIMFDTKSKNRLELEKMVLEKAEYHFDDKCMVLSVTSKMQKKTGCDLTELEGVASMSRSVEGVIAGVSIKQVAKDKFKISMRTYDPLDASAICKELGGGGHKAAAGCALTGRLSTVKAQILAAVKNEMERKNAGLTTN